MTNDELLADLKQFITATVSQATADLATKEELTDLKVGLKSDINHLSVHVDSLEATMNERFDELNGRLDEVLNSEIIKDHERRITRLEHNPA